MSSSSNYQNYVAGEFRTSSEYYDVENPATQELVDRAPVATTDDVQDAVSAARDYTVGGFLNQRFSSTSLRLRQPSAVRTNSWW